MCYYGRLGKDRIGITLGSVLLSIPFFVLGLVAIGLAVALIGPDKLEWDIRTFALVIGCYTLYNAWNILWNK